MTLTVAARKLDELLVVADAYHSDRIGHAEFTRRNTELWREIEALGLADDVKHTLRDRGNDLRRAETSAFPD